MTPQGNATLVNIGVVDFDSIDKKELKTLAYATTPLFFTVLPNNDVFAVHTTDGNFAKVKVTNLVADIGIQWVTYRG